jgi:glucokinase
VELSETSSPKPPKRPASTSPQPDPDEVLCGNRRRTTLVHVDRELSAKKGLANRSWEVDTRQLYETFRLETRITNDFVAVAYSLPSLAPPDLVRVGDGNAEPEAPMAVLGPGSGLGVACLVPGAGKHIVISSEGGHATLAGASDREDEIIEHLRRRFGHVSAERVVSGDGSENIYQAISALDGLGLAPRRAADITKFALADDCLVAREALATFCAFLGSFAGNVALTFGARG